MPSSSRGARPKADQKLALFAAYVQRVNTLILGSRDFQAAADAAVEELGTLLHLSRCIIVLTGKSGRITVEAQWAVDVAPLPHPLSYPAEPIQRALTNGHPIVSYDASGADPDLAAFVEREAPPSVERPQAAMFAVIRKSGALAGCLIAHECRQPRIWSQAERDLLEAVAEQFGAVLRQREMRRQTEDERSWLALILDTAADGIAVVDEHGRYLRLNAAARRILNFPSGDPRQFTVLDVTRNRLEVRYPGGGRVPIQQMALQRALRGETVRDVEEVIHHRDTGQDLHVRLSAAPILDLQGHIRGAVILAVDLSRMKELARLKDDFLSMVSHELRTPITTIRGAALALKRYGDTLDPEDRRQLLTDLVTEGERLHLMVEDLLGLTKSHVGLILQAEPVSLRAFLDRLLPILKERLTCPRLTWRVPQNLPAVDADSAYLEQVVRNLVTNACQHAGLGSEILVTARRDGQMVRVSVLDRGPGIPLEDRERIFEPFVHAHVSGSGQHGIGLGLPVARRLTEIMGGRIWVEGREGGGAAFHVLLPAAIPDS